jgi:hypothetical protein
MLTIGISWIYISVLCGGLGWVAVRLFTNRLKWTLTLVPLSILPFIGLAIVSAITAGISLVSPIIWEWNFLFLAIMALGFAHYRREFLEDIHALGQQLVVNRWFLLFLAVAAGIFLLKSACVVDFYGTGESVFHSDSGYYHAQSIRWIEEYGVVPGLGNLLAPLAIDYLWFQPCALFGFASVLPQRLHSLSGVIDLWMFGFALGGVIQFYRTGGRASWFSIYRMLLFFPLLEIGNYVVSDSGDEPAAVMTLVALGLAMHLLESGGGVLPRTPTGEGDSTNGVLRYAVVLLLVFTVGIKLSALPLLLLVVLIAASAFSADRWSVVIGLAGLSLAVLLPKCVRSIFLSGYLVYPFPMIDLFHVDWKMPASVLLGEKSYVETMSRIRFAKPGELLNGGMSVWFLPWLEKFMLMPLGITFIATAVCGGIALVCFRKTVITVIHKFWFLYATVTVGVVYWFVMAPDVRFAYGFLVAASILLLLPLFRVVLDRCPTSAPPSTLSKLFFTALGIGCLAAMIFTVPRPMPGDSFGRGVVFSLYYPLHLKKSLGREVAASFLLSQDPYPTQKMLHLKLGALEILRPDHGMHCWDSFLPATPFLQKRIEMRGASLRDGFRICEGSVEGFSGYRLQDEWNEMQKMNHKPDHSEHH